MIDFAKVREAIAAMPTTDRVFIVVAVLVFGVLLHQLLLSWTMESGTGVLQIQAAERLIDDLQSGDYSRVIAACDRVDTVRNDLHRAAELNEGNKLCILNKDWYIIQAVHKLATVARTKEERLAGVILLGTFDRCTYDKATPINKALDSNDTRLLKLAIPLAHFDSFYDDEMINRLIAIAHVENFQLAVLQSIFRSTQIKGFNWESRASENLVAFVLLSENSGNFLVRMEAKKLHRLVAFSRAQDRFYSNDADGNLVPDLSPSKYAGGLNLIPDTTDRSKDVKAENVTYIRGLSPASYVNAQKWAQMESTLTLIASAMQIIGIAWGGPMIVMSIIWWRASSREAKRTLWFGLAGVAGGLAATPCINWLIENSRDCNTFGLS